MAESDLHAELVTRIVKSLEDEGRKFFLFVDGRGGNGSIPPTLQNYRPDVFARDNNSKVAIIGEAKTSNDIDNPHTECQLVSYFNFLAQEGTGRLMLSVPWKGLDEMYYIAKRAKRIANAQLIPFMVQGWLIPDAELCITHHG